MASTGDVVAQIRAACEKAEHCRTALEQAEDLAEEAHDMLAGALAGATNLESDVAAMLAAFVYARDGLKGYLWPLITEALRAAESITASLEGEHRLPAPDTPRPAQPHPEQQLSTPPPVGEREPFVVPQERVEAIRKTLPPPVVPRSGQKTVGQWIGPDGTAEPIASGFDRRSALVQGQLARMGRPAGSSRSGDVEQKLAAYMAANGIRHATVIINHVPCRQGRDSCDTLVPVLLPEGSTLTVHGQNSNGTRTRIRYTGGAVPWWR
ncbi:hypothetical protein F4560_003860 [Saccharothrix ecbatanensis]|uniref:Nucleic acid/nucleotide deaminase of polymorphic system toxin n=1 Tax=Saccharothrix ecbatanensis TaxID=1105145 RepID=A0A7W9HKR4_9PSEU|nr:DddA-like double-stranded DNA deaminase toxin [Saccharothrix ecbatanensis]MBB5804092.1 hypothetical protein [Saccharothrix ecbatanensis]